MNVKKRVIVRFVAVGFHNWPEAPNGREYLRHRHRHLFWFQVEAEVKEDDREIEFHNLREEAADALTVFDGDKVDGFEFGDYSCEMIANYVLKNVGDLIAVEVWEDGECGARVEAV